MQPTSNDNSEQPEVTNKTNSLPNESNDKPTRRLKLPKLFHSKRGKIITIIMILVIIAGAFGLYRYSSNNNTQVNNDPVVFSIDDRQFRANEVNPYIEEANQYGVEGAKAKNAIVEAMKLKIAVKNLDIDVSDKSIREALQQTSYAEFANKSEPLSKWIELVGYRVAIENLQKSQAKIAKRGYSFVFYYGNLIIPNEPADSNFPGFGDQTLIKRDKDYAKKKAEEYRDKLSNGKITPDQAIEQLKTDKQLNFGYLPNSSYATKFGTGNEPNITWQNEVRLHDIVEFIEKEAKVKEFSEIKSGRLNTNFSGKESKDAYLYFTYLTSDSDKLSNLKQELAKMKVVIN